MLKGFGWACLLAGAAWGQQPESGAKLWEIGAIGGYGYAPRLTVTGPSGSADTGLKNGALVGVFGGNDSYNYWSGEARYLYRYSDLTLSSGGAKVDFGGHTHIVTGDILGHFRPRTARIRPFIGFGGGVKLLKGTGIESAAQPLGRLAALTRTQETLATADVAFGVKVNWRKSFRLRFEVHDYISHSPSKVIAAAPGASLTGMMNDIQGQVSVSYTW